jgi:hypothetical protein
MPHLPILDQPINFRRCVMDLRPQAHELYFKLRRTKISVREAALACEAPYPTIFPTARRIPEAVPLFQSRIEDLIERKLLEREREVADECR